jgi:hypothetical protein
MKTVNLKISLIALAIGIVTVSCGGGNSNKQSGTVSETKAEAPKDGAVAVSQTIKPADYTTGALAKMASLGKTEKDKWPVTVGGNSDWTVYTVRTFADGKCTDNSDCTFCQISARNCSMPTN